MKTIVVQFNTTDNDAAAKINRWLLDHGTYGVTSITPIQTTVRNSFETPRDAHAVLVVFGRLL